MAVLNADQLAIRKFSRKFAEQEIAPHAAQYDRTEEFPWENLRKMAAAGFLGMNLDPSYGGGGADAVSHMIAIEEISRACGSTGVIMAVHTSAGALPIAMFGDEDQKRRYLPGIASGERLAAFSLSEPNAGSDAAHIAATAVPDGGEYILNGTKCFVTNGGAASIYTVFASVDRSKGAKGITAFLVEDGTPGFTVGKKEEKLGVRASWTTDISLSGCRIPAARRLGSEGQGFAIAMSVLDSSRMGIGAQAVGIAQGAYEAALEYAKQRKQFGRPIIVNQGISFMLADMAMRIESARQMVLHTASLKDAGLSYSTEAAMAKTLASDMAVNVTLDAVQVLSGYGYSREYPVERMLRDAKATQIYEGTNQILRLVIAKHIAG